MILCSGSGAHNNNNNNNSNKKFGVRMGTERLDNLNFRRVERCDFTSRFYFRSLDIDLEIQVIVG